MIRVNEQFDSIQGEGFWTGTPCHFIRLQGCTTQCPWCDSKSTWDLDGGTLMTFQEILDRIPDGIRHVVITGGEPALHSNLPDLVEFLTLKGYCVHIETSGIHHDTLKELCNPTWMWWMTISPKFHAMPKSILTLLLANEIKWIITEKEDLAIVDVMWTAIKNSEPEETPLFYLQPVSCEREATDLCVEHVLANANRDYRLSIQVHQYIGVK